MFEVYQGCLYVTGMLMATFVCMYFHCCFGLRFNLHGLVPWTESNCMGLWWRYM